MTRSSRTRPRWRRRLRTWRRRITLGSFFADLNYSIEMTDAATAALEDRVSALEEIIAAKVLRRMALRRRLARKLRASSATFSWAGDDFRTRRAEAMSEDIVLRSPKRPQ